jgi:hypothetical protein
MFLLKYVLSCKQLFFIFLVLIRINCNRISEGLLYTVTEWLALLLYVREVMGSSFGPEMSCTG